MSPVDNTVPVDGLLIVGVLLVGMVASKWRSKRRARKEFPEIAITPEQIDRLRQRVAKHRIRTYWDGQQWVRSRWNGEAWEPVRSWSPWR